MAKRKRTNDVTGPNSKIVKSPRIHSPENTIHLQIVAGSYERVLHGITAAIPISLLQKVSDSPRKKSNSRTASFADSFLLTAHTSAIKCIAIAPSPPSSASSPKVILATGSTDEKINLFHLSTRIPRGPVLPALGSKTQENSSNRSLGTLYTHDAPVTALHFPNRSKLLSSCGNNVIAITSTKTFNTLSMIKAPNPKHPNRPTGDTSTASTLPNGVNDFAVHPSMKLMISVGRAERNMRLWNLVTGRKAGVLAFSKDMLKAVGEGTRWGSGEGRRVLWSPDGDKFAVVFEKGICIFGMDCNPKALITPEPVTKLHQVHYIPGIKSPILVASTEDGRLLFYATNEVTAGNLDDSMLPSCLLLGQLGGRTDGLSSRIKDFSIVPVLRDKESAKVESFIFTTAGSDGYVRLWTISPEELIGAAATHGKSSGIEGANGKSVTSIGAASTAETDQIGHLIGLYETNNRITCLVSFLLSGETDDDDTVVQSKPEVTGSDDDEEDDNEEAEERTDEDDEVEDDEDEKYDGQNKDHDEDDDSGGSQVSNGE